MKKRVLLVEYATASIDIIKEILSNPIFSIKVANEGETAKEYLDNQPFDLMITAAMLPKFHGFNLSQYAAENFSNLKIIIISEIYKGMNYKHQATTIYKAHDFFEKPFNKEAFKKRVYELLGIDDKVLQAQAKLTTTQIPISDTKKIPTMKKIKEEGQQLTSADLFGDIIDKVQDIPSYEIKLNGNSTKPPTPKKDMSQPPVTQRIFPDNQDSKQAVSNKTQKIDLDILDLIKTGTKERQQDKEKLKFKKIEDDISRRLEDTLSGLGFAEKPAPSKPKKPIPPTEVITPSPPRAPVPPVKPQAPKAAKPIDIPTPSVHTKKEDILPDDNEKTDEVGVVGYEILGQIGRGGMAEVFKAKKKGIKGFEKVIALKKILSGFGTDKKYIEMFVDEAKIAAELSHPNIVQIYDLGKKDDYYFIAMEYVSGKDLRVILQKLSQLEKTMPEELAIYMITRILEALNYAHSARDFNGNSLDIVHRDISPPNILVSYGGDVKLTDFGVSKASTKMHQTLAGALKGKLLYMSPEQAKGENTVDHRSDLYSVGIILFELITGEKLFLGTSEIGTLKKVQEGKIIRPSQIKNTIDSQLETIILKALNKDMNKRYQRASDMAKELDSYMMKTYTNMPESSHIAHFLFDLFKEEIIKEGIEVNLNNFPSPIRKKKQLEEAPKPTEPVTPELPDVDHWEEPNILIDTKPESTKPADTGQDKVEDFQPIIEINFDDDKISEKPETKPPFAQAPAPPPPPKKLSQLDTFPHFQETKKQKNLLIIMIVAIISLAIAITLFLVLGSGSDEPDLKSPAQSLSTPVSTPPTGTDIKEEEGSTTESTSTETIASQLEMNSGDEAQSTESPKPEEIKKDISSKDIEPKVQAPDKKNQIPELTSTEEKKNPEIEKKKKKQEQEIKPKEVTKPEESITSNKSQPVEQNEPEVSKSEPQSTEAKPLETTVNQPVQEKKSTPEPVVVQAPVFKEGDILSPSQVDSQPEAISTPSIRITHSLRRILTDNQRILVSYLVDHNGNVEIVKVLSKSHIKKLDSIIIDTIKKWKYKPAMKNNIRVKIWKNQWILIQK